MEKWQIDHINQNLNTLIDLTDFNSLVKAELVAKKVLSKADVAKLVFCNWFHYYQTLMQRKGAYKVLYEILVANHQSGAYTILVRVPYTVFSKPLTYLGIPTEWETFQDLAIEVHGKTLKIRDFFPALDYESLHQVFKSFLTEVETYDTLVTKHKPFVLASNSVPPKPSYYVPRFLSNRIKVDESIFKRNCPDVFVFKNAISRYKLSQIAKPHYTDTSTSQLLAITSRFIYLDDTEDWSVLKKSAKVPIHLINYEADSNVFLLEDTSVPSDLFSELGFQKEDAYVSETTFVEQHLKGSLKTSSVYICDSPGMGKTFMLASIARQMTEQCTGCLIVYLSLDTFCSEFSPHFPNNTPNIEVVLQNVLKYISPSKNIGKLLYELVKIRFLGLKIFFDGFDEISLGKIQWTKQVFALLTTTHPKINIYLTSRPHMRNDLAKTFGVVAFDILPFSQHNQVDFLVQFWLNLVPSSKQSSLHKYASSCLKAVKKSLTKNDKDITGIPLLCQLIAELYADKVAVHPVKWKFCDVPLKIPELYQTFIEKKIAALANSKMNNNVIKLVHIWHALKLIFPTNGFLEDSQFKRLTNLLSASEVLRAGILQKHSNSAPEFIHRTFAEYLVAEYFFTKLTNRELIPTGEQLNCNPVLILKSILKCYKTFGNYEFSQHVVVFFFNLFLCKANFPDELINRAATFVSSVTHEDILLIICACCQHNFFNIFTFFKKSLTNLQSFNFGCFTDENWHEILSVCIRKSSSQIFRGCIQLLTEVCQIDRIHTYDTLLQLAVTSVNYEAVEYFVDKIPLKGKRLLESCIQYSYDNDLELEIRENILQLLLSKGHTLIQESPQILVLFRIPLRLMKVLIQFGAKLFCVDNVGRNFVMIAAEWLSPVDFFELVQFVLKYPNAEKLFFNNWKWKDPLSEIIQCTTLLPQTLELMLNIPGLDVMMEKKYGENLLFAAVRAGKLSTLQQLISHGLDFNAKGWRETSLLHVAAWRRDAEMIEYLLSLKLDPNARTDHQWTPLHFATERERGSIKVVDILVQNGSNIHAENLKEQTALHFSVNSTNEQVANYLLEKGAVVNSQDKYGDTPLHLCKNKELIKVLIKRGANIHAKNYEGQTPAQKNPESW